MNTLQLEQLISGYVDDELSPNRKLEVKTLLETDPAAQKLYDEFVAMRNEIRKTLRHNLPHDFQKNLFDRIDRETVTVSGKHIEQTTTVDFTLPVAESVAATRHLRPDLATRLKNPRAWVIPAIAAVLTICVVFVAVNFLPNGQHVAHVQPDVHTVEVEPVEPIEQPYYPPPPLPAGGAVPENSAILPLAMRDGKPVVEIACELSPTAQDSQYIPKLLADNGYNFSMRQNGNKAVTVYEFEIADEQILSALAMLRESNRDELKGYKYPPAFLTLLDRENSQQPPTVPGIIVRLNVTR
jgi:negative regulator of sigma E activity